MASRASGHSALGWDPDVYPVSDGEMGEGSVHRAVTDLVRALIAQWLSSRGERAFVGSNQFIYWRGKSRKEQIAPDVYVLPGVEPESRIDHWDTRTGVAPSFVLEVVSKDIPKDYVRAPLRYSEVGVSELVLFDPDAQLSTKRALWHVYRHRGGRFVLSERTARDRVRSTVLGCYLRAVGEGDRQRVRLATGARGERIFPTVEEALRRENEKLRAKLRARRR